MIIEPGKSQFLGKINDCKSRIVETIVPWRRIGIIGKDFEWINLNFVV
jgi:hypothetical protein